jgi:MoaA/NifB/PqqE/SkfB family radical SAM enzyme
MLARVLYLTFFNRYFRTIDITEESMPGPKGNYTLNRLKRIWDDKPIAAHLYVTDNCNLECDYCTEYDHSAPHPPLDDIKKWITKIRDLGALRIGLQGGEPLMHPDIVEIVRYCAREMGLLTTVATNGFLLSEEMAFGLKDAGLSAIYLSVDRMTPIPSTRKSLKTIIPKMKYLDAAGLRYIVSGVLFGESVAQSEQVLEYCLEHKVPVQARIVHTGTDGTFSVSPGEKAELQRVLDFQHEKKRSGETIHVASAIIDYQRKLIENEPVDWTCLAGYKYFFVSAKGEFWQCSMNRAPNTPLMDVTPEMLKTYNRKKSCQKGCGVYCTVGESLFNNHPLRFLRPEIRDRIKARFS